ncbi:hypothetical protein XENOCAPTIV_006782, partial [Xenoophorus captivus]
GGEVTRPLDPSPVSSAGPLPPPLIPLPKRRASDCEPAEEEEGREAPTLPQDLGTNISLELGEPEVAAEAYNEIGGSPTEEEQEDLSDTELDDRERSDSSSDHSELFSLPPASLIGGDAGYLNQAAKELTAAMEREKEGEFSSAIRGYRTAVDILITGVQGNIKVASIQSTKAFL